MVKTLYVNNLNERIPHKWLRFELTKLFGAFGPVTAIVTSRGLRKRGQAFIAFETPEAAQAALSALETTDLFSKKLRVAWARTDLTTPNRQNRKPHDKGVRKDLNEQQSNGAPGETVEQDFGEPHNVLLLQKIPESVQLADLKTSLSAFAGFVDARMLSVKHVGFVDFDSVDNAAQAIVAISGLNLGKVTFAKK